MHTNSLLIFREHVAQHIPRAARVLEVGPDASPSSFARECGCPHRWETADLAAEGGQWRDDHSEATILMVDEYTIPVADGTYDVVFSAQVMEHVREIWTWMAELARVTKAGGQVITITPVSWPYHEAPVDCWRLYPAAMEAVARFAGLEVELSWWGSLEPSPSRRTYPGVGADPPRNSPRASRLKKLLGWPVPVAYDMVTIARKPI